jgi:hypothetical protein
MARTQQFFVRGAKNERVVFAPPFSREMRENGTFFEFSLCLSRACLGKMLIFIYKWLKKCRFLTGVGEGVVPEREERIILPAEPGHGLVVNRMACGAK